MDGKMSENGGEVRKTWGKNREKTAGKMNGGENQFGEGRRSNGIMVAAGINGGLEKVDEEEQWRIWGENEWRPQKQRDTKLCRECETCEIN
jgi:hypothetical protein